MKPVNILLIHPPGLNNGASFGTLTVCLPLGLAYVAAAIEKAGLSVDVLDAVGEAPTQVGQEGLYFRVGLSILEIVSRIPHETRVIGISVMFSFLWPMVRQLIEQIKLARPDIQIVGGGEHFSATAEYCLETSQIDFIVKGEGEDTAVELFSALIQGQTDFSSIDGIIWKENGKIRINKPRSRIAAVDQIPTPAWHFFKIESYDKKGFVNGIHRGVTIPIMATRGCPYACTYCSSPGMWTQRWIARDPIQVVDEIESYTRLYQATNFPFHDLTAIIRKDWIIQFCKELIQRNLKITWQLPSGTRCEAVDEEVAALLAQSGGQHIAYAPESGSADTRKRIKKQMSDEALFRSIKASVRHRLNVTAFHVIGFPHDTREDLKQTVRFVRKLALEGVDDISIGFFFPLPNTELYRYLESKGRAKLDDEFLTIPLRATESKLFENGNFCENLSASELSFYKYWIFLNFYITSFLSRPQRIFMLIQHFFSGKEETRLESFLQEVKRRVLWMFHRDYSANR